MATMPKLKITFLHNNAEVTHEVQVIFADMVRWDILRKRFDFPTQEEATSIWMGVLGYSALVRTGVVANTLPVDKFLETLVAFDPIVEDEEAAEFPAVSTD